MRTMFTSFGVDQDAEHASRSMFFRMPPVSFRHIAEGFMPNYDLLLLTERVVMDGASYEALMGRPAVEYSRVADTFRELKEEGRIELVDFRAILTANQGLLDRMLEHDMRILDQWIVPLRESLLLWRRFSSSAFGGLRDDTEGVGFEGRGFRSGLRTDSLRVNMMLLHEVSHIMHAAMNDVERLSMMVDEALESSRKRKLKEYRSALREVLSAYLSYVNANLILSNELDVSFHDWLDFHPFYSQKFLSVGLDAPPDTTQRREVERLFSIPFPDLAIRDTRSLLRALNDKRIEDLRTLVADAAAGKVEFDQQFARSVLSEVLTAEQKNRRWRNIVGYATLPVGFIPWIGTPAQKMLEEAVGTPLERKLKSKHKWFYMLSEIAGDS